MSHYSPEYLCNRCGVFPCECGFEKESACPNCDRLNRENEQLRKVVDAIANYDPYARLDGAAEYVYDEFAYRRMVETYRRAAREALQVLGGEAVKE